MENERNIDELMDVVEPCTDLLLAVVDDVTEAMGLVKIWPLTRRLSF